jgi:hypothetical protein
MNKFWTHFLSAYGAIWFAVLTVALLSHSHIDTGRFGLYGFPLISLAYALYQRDRKTPTEWENERLRIDNQRLEELVRLLKKETRTED